MFIGLNFGLTGEPVTVNVPSTGEPREHVLAKDFDLQIAVATASTSNLVVTFKRCVNDVAPDIKLDSDSGLLLVEDVDAPTAGNGSVTRDSATQVSIHIDADAFDHLRPGAYQLDLTELTLAGLTLLRHTVEIYFVRSAGRTMA